MKKQMLRFLVQCWCVCMMQSHCMASPQQVNEKVFHYYCTVADAVHYPLLLNLIGSIHQVDFDQLDEIAVFDIGFTQEQRAELGKIQKTKVYDVEKVHPDIFTYFLVHPCGKEVRGWYLWKPVVTKQALDLFPYYLYLDAASLVMSSPDNLFKHIKQNGYFLLNIAPHNIADRITQPVIDKVLGPLPSEDRERLLRNDTYHIAAGVQGLSEKMREKYIMPAYRNAFDISLFADDGTTKLGFGSARPDQTIYSIYANLMKLSLNDQGWSTLLVDGKSVPFHYHWDAPQVIPETCIYSCRWDWTHTGGKRNAIRWKAE